MRDDNLNSILKVNQVCVLLSKSVVEPVILVGCSGSRKGAG